MHYLRSTVPAVAVMLLLFSANASAQDTYPELPRFQQVSDKLYRGAQPREGGIARLRELGINTIVNLRGAGQVTRAEEADARAAGLNYFNVELPNWGRPQEKRVTHVLELITAPENGRVLVHCKDGVDRTGLIVAVYRMTHDRWTRDEALAEAERQGMRRTQFWMRDYVKDYGDRVDRLGPDAALKSPHVHEDFDDRIGASMRFVERGTFGAQKAAGLFFRKISGSFR